MNINTDQAPTLSSLVQDIYLIVGLGNPGREHRHNRHNVGFMCIDRLAIRLDQRFTRLESKALVVKDNYQSRRLILAKPQTFMNLSGQPTASLLKYYRIPFKNLIVAYDDVDLPFGMLRIRPDGGSAGHRGMRSIIERLGTEEFARMRIGIGRPPGKREAADYVLQNFSRDEMEVLPVILDRSVEAIFTFITTGLDTAMNRYNGEVNVT